MCKHICRHEVMWISTSTFTTKSHAAEQKTFHRLCGAEVIDYLYAPGVDCLIASRGISRRCQWRRRSVDRHGLLGGLGDGNHLSSGLGRLDVLNSGGRLDVLNGLRLGLRDGLRCLDQRHVALLEGATLVLVRVSIGIPLSRGAVRHVLDHGSKVIVVGLLSVERHVEAHGNLGGIGHDGRDEVDDEEEEVRDDEGVGGSADARSQLLAKEHAAPLHTPDVGVSEESKHEGAEETAHTVNTPHVQGIVPPSRLHNLDAAIAPPRGAEADEESGPRAHKAGGRRDRGEASDGADAGADKGWLSEVGPLNGHPEAHGHRGGDGRVDESKGSLGVGGEGRAPVESKPANPKEAGAEGDKGTVVGDLLGLALFLRAVLAGPDDEEGGEGGKSGRDVNDDAASKVADAPVVEEALGRPAPVDEGAVYEDEPEDDEEQVGLEANAVRKGTCSNDEARCAHMSGRQRSTRGGSWSPGQWPGWRVLLHAREGKLPDDPGRQE